MPLKTLTEIPERTTNRGVPIPEIAEILEALKTLPKNKAIEVSLSTETAHRFTRKNTKTGKLSNPIPLFVTSLRRRFENDGLPLECYPSSSMTSVIVRYDRKRG